MRNKLHPLSFARKWVLSVGTVMTARACVGITITIKFGKQAGTVWLPGRGMYRNWKQCRSCPSRGCSVWTFAEANVLSEPLWNPYFLTAGNTAGKISLVQITAPYFGLCAFLYDHLDTVMVETCFSGIFHTFTGSHIHKFLLLSYRFYPNWPLRCRTYLFWFLQKITVDGFISDTQANQAIRICNVARGKSSPLY